MYDIYEDSVRCNWWELTDGKSIVFNEHENLIQSSGGSSISQVSQATNVTKSANMINYIQYQLF